MSSHFSLSFFTFFFFHLAALSWLRLPQWLAEVYKSQGLYVQGVMAYRQSLQLASQLGVHHSQVTSLLRLALLALGPCMVSTRTTTPTEWKLTICGSVFSSLKSLRQASLEMSGRACYWRPPLRSWRWLGHLSPSSSRPFSSMSPRWLRGRCFFVVPLSARMYIFIKEFVVNMYNK